MPNRKGKSVKRKNKSRMVSPRRGFFILPDEIKVILPYSSFARVTGTPFSQYAFTVNGMFDPDVTGVGLQPMGFDEWTAFYTHYEVLASTITVYANNQTSIPASVTIVPRNENLTILGLQADEYPYSITRLVSDSVSSPRVKMVKRITVRQLEGRTTASVNFAALTSANPAILKYWNLAAMASDSISTVDVIFQVRIDYEAKFFRRRVIPRS